MRVLLFSAFTPRRVVAASPGGLRVNGRRVKQAVLEFDQRGLLLDGVPTPPPLAIAPLGRDGSYTLTIAQRQRTLRHPLHVDRSDRMLLLVLHLPRAEYLAATLAAETTVADPRAYLIALSLVQRNFLETHRNRHAPDADLCDNTHCQAANPDLITPRISGAVAAAALLDLGDSLVRPSFYSACCGGGTLTPLQVWGTAGPGYTNVECDHCRRSTRYRWRTTIPVTPDVERLLRAVPPAPFVNDDLRIALGRIAGFNRVPGNTFDRVVRRGREYLLEGRGFGHRIGLCQEGARTLARNGWSPDRIIRFYFPTVPLTPRSPEER